jgi:hypothetical protein
MTNCRRIVFPFDVPRNPCGSMIIESENHDLTAGRSGRFAVIARLVTFP